MWIVAILLLVGLVFCLVSYRKNPAAVRLAAVALVVVAVIYSVFSFRHRQPLPNLPGMNVYPHARGFVLGQTIATAIPTGGEVLVLMFHNFGVLQDEVNRQFLKGLREGLGPAFRVAETGVPKSEPPDLHALFDTQRIGQWILTKPEAVAVVSCLGAPQDGTAAVMEKWPPYYCDLMGKAGNWEPLLKAGRIRTAVVPLPGGNAPAELPPGLTWQQIFDQQYQLLKPDSTP